MSSRSSCPWTGYDYEQIAREVLEEAQAVDAAEDELYGEARRDELPEQLRIGEGRRAWVREAKRQLEAQRQAPLGFLESLRAAARERPRFRLDRGASRGQDGPSGRSQRDVACRAVEQAHSQLPLQPADRRADRLLWQTARGA